MNKIIFVLLVLGAYPLQSFGWGAVGHRAVARIAQDHLSDEAKDAVAALLGRQSMEDVANWADQLRSTGTHRQTNWYHFEKVPDSATYIQNLKDMPEWQQRKGGTVSSIVAAMDVLRDSQQKKTLQRDALKFLIHFVGDIHQPLHSGRPGDLGGVKTNIEWMGHPTNLHGVWDKMMFFTGHSDILNFRMTQTQAARALSRYLKNHFDAKSVSTEIDVEGWLNESMALRDSAYDPSYQADQAKYQRMNLRHADQRVFASGIRLAAVLNDIYATKRGPGGKEAGLRQDIENIVGDLHDVISFEP